MIKENIKLKKNELKVNTKSILKENVKNIKFNSAVCTMITKNKIETRKF